MTWFTYGAFFRQATGGTGPYRYQTRLAEGPVLPSLVHLPTGVGKTLAITLAWLWRRRYHPDPAARTGMPRRLVYCLPMRNLVEQTRGVIQHAVRNLGTDLPVYTLMGGEVEEEWLTRPEAETILIGTQDMLLSRGLNRGYAMSRYRWPTAYALLNNDALWVLDEVQIFGVGLETSAQLQAFRQRLGTIGPTQTVWMSATLQPDWVATVDHPRPEEVFRLLPDEESELARRLQAEKRLTRLDVGDVKEKAYGNRLAQAVAAQHQAGTLTLCICNTIDRAVQVFKALSRLTDAEPLLLHSRFRPYERRTWAAQIDQPIPPAGRIIVSTQVVEAGVDLNASLLVTELAPWPSLVQRFGRCNRTGEYPEAKVLWVDVSDQSSPYTPGDLNESRLHMNRLEGQSVGPANLPPVSPERPLVDLLRRRDLIDLFDTTPDLMGNDVDVSRCIREGDEYDLHIFWREFAESDLEGIPDPERDELCPAPISQARKWLLREHSPRALVFDHLLEQWRRVSPRDFRPGAVLLLSCEAGGYSPELGWDPGVGKRVEPVPIRQPELPEGYGGDRLSATGRPQSLAEHTAAVASELETILTDLPALAPFAADLTLAAWYHDLGKAHPVFQETMIRGLPEGLQDQSTLWAKTGRQNLHHRIKGFRHELVSALAYLQELPDQFLPAYLIGAHHGRVRLAVRSLPGAALESKERRILGVSQGDELPPVHLCDAYQYPGGPIDLTPIQPDHDRLSWTEQAIALRDRPDLGPFRLALLEAILRAADQRASARANEEVME